MTHASQSERFKVELGQDHTLTVTMTITGEVFFALIGILSYGQETSRYGTMLVANLLEAKYEADREAYARKPE